MPGKPIATFVVVVASVLSLACVLVGGPIASVLFGVATLAFPPALIGLAVARGGRVGPLRWPLLLLAVLLQGSLVAMLVLSPRPDPGEWWFGLPPSTAILLLGPGLMCLLLVSLAYALTFSRHGPNDDDLRRIRDLRRRRETGRDTGESRP
jgi:hypothetical protein